MNLGGVLISNANRYIHVVQINAGDGGAASLSCDIVSHCNIFEFTAQAPVCDPFTNTFTLTGEIYFANPPSTGFLAVWDSATGYSSLNTPPFVSPFQYSIPGLPCDNQMHTIYASFMDSVGCENSIHNQAPILCPDATISGGGNICNNGIDSVAISISFTPNVQLPITFVIQINGEAQAPINTSGPFPCIFYTRTPGIYNLLQSSNALCSGTVSGQAIVNLHPLPQPELGSDIHACEGKIVVLDAGTGFQSYLWNTDENNQTIEITQAGTYYVTVYYSNNSSNSDTVNVFFQPAPIPLLIKHY